MTAPSKLVYSVQFADPAPAPDAPWAITVSSGEEDPSPRVLAYARAEHIAQRICLALRQSDRLAREDNAATAATFVDPTARAGALADDA